MTTFNTPWLEQDTLSPGWKDGNMSLLCNDHLREWFDVKGKRIRMCFSNKPTRYAYAARYCRHMGLKIQSNQWNVVLFDALDDMLTDTFGRQAMLWLWLEEQV